MSKKIHNLELISSVPIDNEHISHSIDEQSYNEQENRYLKSQSLYDKANPLLKEFYGYILGAFFIWCCIVLIKQQGAIHQAITNATLRCLNIIIPSLFAFMTLSAIVISSKVYIYISKPFYPITKLILAIPNQLFFLFLMGNISGYPIGAKLICQLLEEQKISKKSAAILICSCYGGGPAFFTGAIGMTLFGATDIGIIIFISVISANIITAMVLNRIYKINYKSEEKNISLNADNIINSIISTGKSMFIICVTIIFFAVVLAVIESKGLFEFLSSIGLTDNQCILIKSILEISNLSEIKNAGMNILPQITAVCSFGGICVLIQLKAIVGKAYSLKYFFISRLVTATLSGAICKQILHFFTPKSIYASTFNTHQMIIPDNVIPSLCLIGMIMIVYLNKKRLSALHEQS